jgi:hypothetical protein
MGVQLTKKSDVKNISTSNAPLGVYKDLTTKKLVVFDDKGNTENVISHVIDPFSSVTVSITANPATSGSATINSNNGEISLTPSGSGNIANGATYTLTVTNSSITTSSNILLTLQADPALAGSAGATGAAKVTATLGVISNGSFIVYIYNNSGETLSAGESFNIRYLILNI